MHCCAFTFMSICIIIVVRGTEYFLLSSILFAQHKKCLYYRLLKNLNSSRMHTCGEVVMRLQSSSGAATQRHILEQKVSHRPTCYNMNCIHTLTSGSSANTLSHEPKDLGSNCQVAENTINATSWNLSWSVSVIIFYSDVLRGRMMPSSA